MPVADGAVLQVTVEYEAVNSSIIQNVYHFLVEASSPASEALVEVACELAMTTMYDEIDTYVHYQCTSPMMRVDELAFNAIKNQWEIYRRIAEDELGGVVWGATGELLPPGLAALVQFIPIFRKHVGYKYIGGLTESVNDSVGTPASALTAALVNYSLWSLNQEWDIETGFSTMQPIILNRTHELWNFPLAAYIPNQWAYQRRRRANRGL